MLQSRRLTAGTCHTRISPSRGRTGRDTGLAGHAVNAVVFAALYIRLERPAPRMASTTTSAALTLPSITWLAGPRPATLAMSARVMVGDSRASPQASRPGTGVTTGASLYYFALVTKALVLSGGGSVGIAWEIGVAAGLARAGVDVRDADFITGTSAGSAVGAQLALQRDLDELVSRQRRIGSISAPGSSRNAAGGPAASRWRSCSP